MLLALDSFDHYATTTDLVSKWGSTTSTWAVSTLAARTGTQGVRLTYTSTTSQYGIRYGIGSAKGTIIVGAAFRFSTLPASGKYLYIFQCAESSQASPNGLVLDSTGALRFTIGGSGTPVTGDNWTGTALVANTWYYIEWKIKWTGSTATGDIECQVDGTLVNTAPSGKNTQFNTGTGGFSYVCCGCFGPVSTLGVAWTLDLDDFYICDATGTHNNAFLGACKVECLMPNGAGSNTQFTPNATGANYTKVDETPENGDTTYVSTSTVGNRDSYTINSLSSNPNTIFGVQVGSFSRADAGETTRTIGHSVKSGGTTTDGSASNNLSSSYAWHGSIFETDPSGSTWVQSTVNAMEAGIKLDS